MYSNDFIYTQPEIIATEVRDELRRNRKDNGQLPKNSNLYGIIYLLAVLVGIPGLFLLCTLPFWFMV